MSELNKELEKYIDHLFNTDQLQACDLLNRVYAELNTAISIERHKLLMKEQREACAKAYNEWANLFEQDKGRPDRAILSASVGDDI